MIHEKIKTEHQRLQTQISVLEKQLQTLPKEKPETGRTACTKKISDITVR